jgi:hypothetical protein
MKKLLAPLTLIALAGILFSSCSNSSKLAFTKRHYRSGYFVDRIGKVKTVPTIAGKPVKTAQQTIPLAITKLENPVFVYAPVVALQNEQLLNSRINSASTGKNIVIANTYATNNIAEGPAIDNKQAISANQGDGGGSSERAALSLLWIVIVVILIIWLIAIVVGGFGLGGGLINLLLLIALILLILWLLRIW